MTHTILQQTPLRAACEKAGGKMVDFHGWLLPVQFAGIIAEHKAVRQAAGVFDVSHMGQILVEGKDAWPFLHYINSNQIKNTPAAGTYSHILTEKGTIIDDAISFCLTAEKFLVVVNAACVAQDYAWFLKQASAFDVQVHNLSADYGMVAVQGPQAMAILDKIIPGASLVARFNIKEIACGGAQGYLTRTGYTGEDGAEVMLPPMATVALWEELLAQGVTPCGLGARDVLRLEAGYLLNGVDADQTRTPYEANCGWVVKLAKENFVGKTALEAQKAQGVKEKLTAFVLTTPGVPRGGCAVYGVGAQSDVQIGTLTSGTYSPLFKGIAVGYASAELALEQEVEIEIHGKRSKAKKVKTPFYQNKV